MTGQENSNCKENRGSGAVSDIVGVSRDWACRLLKRETWYSMSLGLKRLQELIQGTSSLNDDPVWLLGLWYGLHDADTSKSSMTPELHQLLLDDLNGRFWFTYRRDFPPLGPNSLTSDVGWGCTLRSGQMLLAEALSRCWWGREARFTAGERQHDCTAAAAQAAHDTQGPQQPLEQPPDQQLGVAGAAAEQQAGSVCGSSSQAGPDQLRLLQLFVDQPGPQAPFSIHNLCTAGATHGVVPGQWLGPWVLCKALAAAAVAAAASPLQQGSQGQQQPHQLHHGLGLHVHVACDPGGGAPQLDPQQLRQLLPADSSSNSSSRQGVAAVSSPRQQQQQQPPHETQQPQQPQGLLLLVPLTLGVGKVNERYLPQLASVLSFPQSVGIVGGRPGASLYFVGVQGGAVLYLDPHEVQEVPVLPRDEGSFHCSLPRLMPLTAIDPSLAIGFFCGNTGELEDLLSRLQELAASAGGAPLMTVEQPGRASTASDAAVIADDGTAGEAGECGRADDWELV